MLSKLGFLVDELKEGFSPLPYIWNLLRRNQKSVCKKITAFAKQCDGGQGGDTGGTSFFGLPDGIRTMNPKELECGSLSWCQIAGLGGRPPPISSRFYLSWIRMNL